MLHFYISDQSKKWSTIFKIVEDIKNHNPDLIEDYAISEASLEDVFLSVAKSDDFEEPEKSKRKWKRNRTETI